MCVLGGEVGGEGGGRGVTALMDLITPVEQWAVCEQRAMALIISMVLNRMELEDLARI